MKRETAWRIFASEYNDTTYEQKSTGEKTPSYVITPLGAKINRLYIVGVLTDVENITEGGDLLRAHVSDPTGVFTLYSGQYQPEATQQLSNIQVPAFVAVIGKTRTYEPEEGTVFVSIRPEQIIEVNAETRDRWILETSIQTKNRIEAYKEAINMNQPSSHELRKLGYSRELSEGITLALKNYQNTDLTKYISLIKEALYYITPEPEKTEQPKETPPITPQKPEQPQQTPTQTKKQTKTTEPTKTKENEDTEQLIMKTIKSIEGEDGAPWDIIVEKCKETGIDENTIEEALNSLMDKGFIFEPMLGILKTT